MTWSGGYTGPKASRSAMQDLSSCLGQETETCGNLQTDSEQTNFLKSPGRTMIPTGTRRACENVISLSHPKDHLAYSPCSF